MRIGFFSDRYLPLTDGITFSIEGFRLELEKLGHEVYVFAPGPGLRYKEPSKRIVRFPAVKGLFFDDYLTSLFFPPQVIKRIEKLDLDIIHYHTPGQIGLLGAYFALRHNIPLVTTYHTDLYEYVRHYPSVLPGVIALSMLTPVITGGGMSEYRDSLSSIKPERSIDKWNQKIVERGVTMIHNHCDLVITPSHKMEQQLRSWHTQSRIATLPTGVDKITTTEREITNIRRQYGFGPDDQIVLFVGRIGTEKNIGLLIRAFDLVAQQHPKAKLLLVGTGEDIDDFREQAAATSCPDRIIFAGQMPHEQLGAFYGLADIFAFPSLADTQGMVINEAAQAGVPVVMVDRDITEVVKDRQNGFFARGTAKDLGAKISQLLDKPALRQRMGAQGRELAADFTASKQTLKLLRLYEETIEHHHEAVAQTQPANQ